jgi:hypothetical protein
VKATKWAFAKESFLSVEANGTWINQPEIMDRIAYFVH